MDYLLTEMQMENQLKFLSPWNMYGASQQDIVATFFKATEVDDDSKTTTTKQSNGACSAYSVKPWDP